MSMLRICAVLLGALLLTTLWLGPKATAQANCEWYAKMALKQQQENEQRKCGFTGPEWRFDLTAHMEWCRGVAPDVWKKQAQLRNQQLEDCAKR
jgi:hypothetical protein